MSATTLRELAALVRGRIIGHPDANITGAATLHRAQPGDITLADSPKLAKQLQTSKASAIVVSTEFLEPSLPQLVVADAHDAFARIVSHFRPSRQSARIGRSPHAFVAPSARLADSVQVHPFASIGEDVEIGEETVIHSGVRVMDGCQIGDHVTLFPNVVLYEGTVIGPRSTIHAGCVIGAYGFGYQTIEGKHHRAAQLGNVVIGADVELGAGTTVDRGTYDATAIGDGTKVDNQVMIGHNCQIGRHNILCSQVGIAGSCITDDYVVMAGQVGLSDHLHIGQRAVLGAKAGLMNDVPADSTYIGVPATPEREQWKMWIQIRQLPKLLRQMKTVLRQLEKLPPSERQDAA